MINTEEIRHDERMECIKVIERMQLNMIKSSPGQVPADLPLQTFQNMISMFAGIFVGGIHLRDTKGDPKVLNEEIMRVWKQGQGGSDADS